MTDPTAIVWFREDLRLADNPALHHAAQHFAKVIPVYLHCPAEAGGWAAGEASNWWLHHSLLALQEKLTGLDNQLILKQGSSSEVLINQLIKTAGAKAVFWNRMYTPWATQRDKILKQKLRDQGIETHSFNSALIHEPWEVLKPDGGPYKVFTARWRRAIEAGLNQPLAPTPKKLKAPDQKIKSLQLKSLRLLPKISWHKAFYNYWQPGEDNAQRILKQFNRRTIQDYGDARDIPSVTGTSQLSPHLHFGEISPRQIMASLYQIKGFKPDTSNKTSAQRFATEIGWREFSYYMLYHFPKTVDQPLATRFRRFPWLSKKTKAYQQHLTAWQQGMTGIPIVDAGMRQLWHTGWMHNRVRMIVASFLTKNLLIHWQAGADWFWHTLIDADMANNTMGWQWIAGCGADAAPYFRIFNPVTQGEKFDPDGVYVKRWIPELKDMEKKFIHQPWLAATPNTNYPAPIVDLRTTRQQALDAYQQIR